MQVKETPNNPRPGDGTPGPGRPKDVPNKTTALLKDAILVAAEVPGGGEPDGLVNYLVVQARHQNPVAFMTLLGKVLPTQVSGEKNGNIVVEIIKDARVVDGDFAKPQACAGPGVPLALNSLRSIRPPR
jgi:hypothetical protein